MIKELMVAIAAMALCDIPSYSQTKFSVFGKTETSSQHCLYVNNKFKTNAKKFTFGTVNDALLFAQKQSAHLAQQGNKQGNIDSLTIYIEPSVYWIDNPNDTTVRKPLQGENEPFGMKLKFSNVKLVGLSSNPKDVVLACNRGQTQGAVGNFTMLHITGNNISAENITFGNYCNVDLNYGRNTKLSRPRRANAIVQAQLVICNGNNYHIRNCEFISRLNLCPFVGASNIVFDNCYFECTDDALCGTGTYNHCRFTFFSSKPFYCTSNIGAEFNDCDIHTKVHGTQYLTKVSGAVRMYNCRWTSEDPNLKIEWTKKPNPKHICIMRGNTLNGDSLCVPTTPDVPMSVGTPTLTLTNQPQLIEGRWTLDAYKPADTTEFDWSINSNQSAWCYGEGIDGAEGCFGMIQNVRGARLMYTAKSNEQYDGQILDVDLNPCKGAGQGFGSATGQYLDICIKFDTKTLTGYGIRFIRTPQHDNAVDVYLVEYNNAKVTPISKAEVCRLFKKGCHLQLKAYNNKLSAIISNNTSTIQELSATVALPNKFGGIHIQHTGSTGASATVICAINSTYTK